MAAKLVSRNNIGRIPFEEPDDDTEEGDDECLHELQPPIDEVNRLQGTCDTQLPCIQHPEHLEDISAESVVEDFSRKIEALNDGSDRWCADCSKARRVEDMNSLQRGQHISMPGVKSSYYIKSLGKRISAYRHHAIVKNIVQRSCQTAEVILIHFYEDHSEMMVCEQKWRFNLQHDELYIIEYQYSRYDPDTIVQRAESVLEQSENGELFKRYRLFTKNCEHFAIWCVLGEEKSLQAHTFFNDIKQMLWSIFGGSSKIARLILKLFVDSSDEIASFVTKAIHIPSVALGVSSVVHIIYCIIKTVYLIKQYRKEKTICWHCLKEKLLDLWLQFGAFAVTSIITFAIVNCALPLLGLGAAIPIAILIVLVATALTLAVPRIRKALWSPVQYRKTEIKTLSEMNVGDVASLTYSGSTHLVVVSEIRLNTNPEQGTVRGIHYSRPTRGGKREIVEENFQIDLKNWKVNRVHFNIVSTYSPQEVVDRARKRVGEQKRNMSSNRSDHFCRWAVEKSDHNSKEIKCLEDEDSKHTQSGSLSSLLMGEADVHLMNEIQPGDVVEKSDYNSEDDEDTKHTQSGSLSSFLVGKADVHLMNEIQPGDVVEKSDYISEDDEDTKHTQSGSLSSLLVGKADVHLMDEIQPGDVVEYGTYKGIVIQLEDVKDGRVFSMHTIIRKRFIEFYGKKVILRIDLNKDHLMVHRYHPVHCVSRSERVRKAKGMIGKKIQHWTQTGFIRDIILKQR